ncbi:MAG: tyrosine-type recombinase/integrase [Pseudonocardiaceae bacterium]
MSLTPPAAELSPVPRAVDSPGLAERLLIQTRGEHPALAGVGEREQLLAATWLAGHRSPATRTAYAKDLAGWLGWLAQHGLDVLAVRPLHVRLWTRGQLDTGAAAASVNRRLAALSSFYAHCVEHGLVEGNPTAGVRRAEVNPDHTATVGLSREQARALLAAAEADRGRQWYRSAAAVRLLVCNGLRVAELTGADLSDLGHDRGHQVLLLTRKGGGRAAAALAPATTTALERYLEYRAIAAGLQPAELTARGGPLLATARGGRLDQAALWRLVRRLARAAGIPHWAALSPHSLRHTAITLTLDAGASLRDVQDYAGHADPRTTHRYDHARGNLDRHATYALTAYLA